jgi:hypothetical protein
MQLRRNVFPVRYDLSFCIPEDGILHSHRSENLKSYMIIFIIIIIIIIITTTILHLSS